jgi:hypothetical protein
MATATAFSSRYQTHHLLSPLVQLFSSCGFIQLSSSNASFVISLGPTLQQLWLHSALVIQRIICYLPWSNSSAVMAAFSSCHSTLHLLSPLVQLFSSCGRSEGSSGSSRPGPAVDAPCAVSCDRWDRWTKAGGSVRAVRESEHLLKR